MTLVPEMLGVNLVPWRLSEEELQVLVGGITLGVCEELSLIHMLYSVSFCFFEVERQT